MCGINGGWTTCSIPGQVLYESLAAMRHRGPDDQGIFVGNQRFLGNCRLSIIDLAGGHQPIFNEDGSVAVVLNGEIYNYIELMSDLVEAGHRFVSRSDTEVLVHLYEEFGTDMCKHLRGMFAFAISDDRQNRLFIARDHFGKKPLYYQMIPDGMIFASELKSLKLLARHLGLQWCVNEQSVYDYLSLGCVPQPSTIFEGVQALPPGSQIVYDGNGPNITKYWDLVYVPKSKITYSDAVNRTRVLISEAVRMRLRSDVPLGVFLSGGLDSSVVAYEASQVLGRSLRTFTVAINDVQYDESAKAKQTASLLGSSHSVLNLEVCPESDLFKLVTLYDQPFADPSAIPTFGISRLASQHVKVALNGDGGDEFFAGYRRAAAARLSSLGRFFQGPIGTSLAKILNPFSTAAERRAPWGFAARFVRGLISSGSDRYLIWSTDLFRETDKRRCWLRERMRPTEQWIDGETPAGMGSLDTQLSTDVRIILLSTLLVKMDIASMGASLEARSPLMDYKVAEFAAHLPESYKMKGFRTKALLRDAYRGLLPDQVIRGSKYGFEVPLLNWIKGPLRPVVMDNLRSPLSRINSYVEPRLISELVDGREMRDRNWGHLVYSLLMLELWLRENGSA